MKVERNLNSHKEQGGENISEGNMGSGEKAIKQIQKKFQINQHLLALHIRNSLDNYVQRTIYLMNQITIFRALR